jgi:tetratricopeptide (TPR) repeat protein
MADLVQLEIEKMIPELKHLSDQRLFSNREIRDIVKQRTQHEYNIIRRTPYLSDFFRYIQYEIKIELARRRRGRFRPEHWKAFRKPGVSDYSIIGRTFRIFNAALRKFPNNIQLWFQLIDWAIALKSFAQLSTIFPRALRFHPLSTQLWQRAAVYEYEITGDIEAARIYFQRGLRLNPKSTDLWYAFFNMEMSYIGRISKRHVINNILPSIERQEQYDKFIKQLESNQNDSVQSDSVQSELLNSASLLPWTPESASSLTEGDKLLLSGRIAQAIYLNANKTFMVNDGIVSTVVGLSNYYSHRNARGLTVKQKLGFFALINTWKDGREPKGIQRARHMDRESLDAHFDLRRELSLVHINERCLVVGGIDIYNIYRTLLLDIFHSIHANLSTIPDIFSNDLEFINDSKITTTFKLDTDIDLMRQNEVSDDSDQGSDGSDRTNSDDSSDSSESESESENDSPQQESQSNTSMDKPLVSRDDIGSFWDCFARLSLFCPDLEFDLPLDILEEIQKMAPAHRQFTYEIEFPHFPPMLPQLEQRVLTRYLLGIKVYTSFPALADFVPIVFGKLTHYLYNRIMFYFSSIHDNSTRSLIPSGTESHQHLFSIGYAMVDFLESMFAWGGYQHKQIDHLKSTSNTAKNSQIISIPWVSSEMYMTWLKLKMLTINNLPIYSPKTDPNLYNLDSLPSFRPYNEETHTNEDNNNHNNKNSHDNINTSHYTKRQKVAQLPPTPEMLKPQSLSQVFSNALHFIRDRVYQHNYTMANELSHHHSDNAAKQKQSSNGRLQLSAQSNKRSVQYYDKSLEKLVSMVYLTYVNYISRPHWSSIEIKDDDNDSNIRKSMLRSVKRTQQSVLLAYTTLFELHTIIVSSHFVNTTVLSKIQQTQLSQRMGAHLSSTVNIQPLFSFSSLSLYWVTFLKLHESLSNTAKSFQPVQILQNNDVLTSSLSIDRAPWLLPALTSTILNSKFFHPYLATISVIKLAPNSGNTMGDICLFLQLSALRYFQLIKEGYMSRGSNVFIPTTLNSDQISRHTILDVLQFNINTFKTHTIKYCTTLLSTLSISMLLLTNNVSKSDQALSMIQLLQRQAIDRDSKTTHDKLRREQEVLLKQVLAEKSYNDSSDSDSSDSDSDGDDDDDDDDTPRQTTLVIPTNTSLNTIQQTLEVCISASYSPHNAETYNTCLKTFIAIYKQQESQFTQFNQAHQQTHSQQTANSTIRQQQTILLQLQHRVRQLYLKASRDVGRGDIWIWINYAQFAHYLQKQCGLMTSTDGLSQLTKSKPIMTINNPQLSQYSLELLTEIGHIQQNAIKTLHKDKKALFVSTIDSLLRR